MKWAASPAIMELFLPPKQEVIWLELAARPLPIRFTVLEGKHVGEIQQEAAIMKLAPKMAVGSARLLPFAWPISGCPCMTTMTGS